MTDPLDELRRAYDELRPPRAPDAPEETDAATREVLAWLRAAYEGLEVPASAPPERARAAWGRAPGRAPLVRAAAAAALLLAFAAVLHLGTRDVAERAARAPLAAREPGPEAPATRVEPATGESAAAAAARPGAGLARATPDASEAGRRAPDGPPAPPDRPAAATTHVAQATDATPRAPVRASPDPTTPATDAVAGLTPIEARSGPVRLLLVPATTRLATP